MINSKPVASLKGALNSLKINFISEESSGTDGVTIKGYDVSPTEPPPPSF